MGRISPRSATRRTPGHRGTPVGAYVNRRRREGEPDRRLSDFDGNDLNRFALAVGEFQRNRGAAGVFRRRGPSQNITRQDGAARGVLQFDAALQIVRHDGDPELLADKGVGWCIVPGQHQGLAAVTQRLEFNDCKDRLPADDHAGLLVVRHYAQLVDHAIQAGRGPSRSRRFFSCHGLQRKFNGT